MNYVSFGTGRSALVMIPGLGDGLRTVKGMSIPLALMYREYARKYRVFAFSRKNRLEKDSSTRDMARDLRLAMERLGIESASVVGISQGGMIAQFLAIDAPQLVERLVLAVTLARPNDTIRSVLGRWIELAEMGDYKGIFIDTAEKSYTESYLKRYRRLYPLLCRMSKPKDFDRFLIQADACIRHDAYRELGQIRCPTLIIGGDCDQIVGENASQELAERIPGSELIVYRGLGHGAYEEAKDFHRNVTAFLDA